MGKAWRRFVESPAYKYVALIVCVGVVISLLVSPDRNRDGDMLRWSALLMYGVVGVAFAIRDVRRAGGRR